MKARTALLGAIAVVAVAAGIAIANRAASPGTNATAPPPADKPAPAPRATDPRPAASPGTEPAVAHGPFVFAPRRPVDGSEPPAPAAGGAPFPESLGERAKALAGRVDSGQRGEAYELYSLLNECAVAPQRLAISTGCVSGGDCTPPQQRMTRYQDTLAACQDVPADLVARRQQYLDLAAGQGDPRAPPARQQPGR